MLRTSIDRTAPVGTEKVLEPVISDVVGDFEWARRIRGIRCNASRKSHAELDEAETLDDGDVGELAAQYGDLAKAMPWVNVFGGCCGSDLRHVTEIARTLTR